MCCLFSDQIESDESDGDLSYLLGGERGFTDDSDARSTHLI